MYSLFTLNYVLFAGFLKARNSGTDIHKLRMLLWKSS